MIYTISIQVNANARLYIDPQYYIVLRGDKDVSKEFLFNEYILPPHVGLATKGQELIKQTTYQARLIFPNDYGEIISVDLRVPGFIESKGVPIDVISICYENGRKVDFPIVAVQEK